MYDVPTGGGKTLAFYYPLFYHWEPGNIDSECQKIILVISPLTALMDSQAKDLLDRGIPAKALHGDNSNYEDLLQVLIFVSPEKVLSSEFHEKVLRNSVFRTNCISVVIDEGHCIIEWGPDFRNDYDQLAKLCGRIPSTIPILVASATMPDDIRQSIQFKLRLGNDCVHVADTPYKNAQIRLIL
ncbi:P-loop containing nucleoside triphosphate hydrolase protein [Dendrothele bispora CBS 962.96]|uniref:P-loop containing nucleoside triphosphate hydrolase protein n=1 Tax=Dendrothele bispora (strain CBS 962.96) TaxID=1314807 RepID=A0A4S8L068_DENBC|nr:P-loop containing nucleoside triphosphate hydrolase protein [Dendrothele bispora CBS 962.96]